jgi:hypothetical protein
LNVAHCQDKKQSRALYVLQEENMNFQIKLFTWPNRGNHVIIIARGPIDISGFKQMFRKIEEMTRALPDCKVLIDLVDTSFELGPADADVFASLVTPESVPPTVKIAMVGTPEVEQYEKLWTLVDGLSNQGLKVAAFYDSKIAINWLADDT